MEESILLTKEADEEVGAAWTKALRDSGSTGLNQLAILMISMDLMYLLNQVKKHLCHLLYIRNVDRDLIESRLSNSP